ncbi:MAG TPA: 30S ribosome-binding factor RbfA [Deltaproteobacteria bacterium]|nr:30S ribosome-binding factor RbfA [Deltaproteobacteria bacterium]
MKTGRDKRIAEEVRREVSQIFHYELSDPRILGATVTGVKVSPDLRFARVYYALPGAEERKAAAAAGLKKSTGFVRHLLTERLNMKFSPQLEFFYDESFEIQDKIEQLFGEIEGSSANSKQS